MKKVNYIHWGISVCLLILVGLLAYQNFSLKTRPRNADQYSKRDNARLFERQLKKKLLLKPSPVELNLEECYFQSENIVKETNGYILAVFDLTVCGKCLKKGLLALKHFQDAALEKGLQYVAVIGVKSEREDSRVIGLYREGLLSFPCQTIAVNALYEKFSLSRQRFLDTPFFVFLDDNSRVIDFFKPVQYEVKELMQWLEILIS